MVKEFSKPRAGHFLLFFQNTFHCFFILPHTSGAGGANTDANEGLLLDAVLDVVDFLGHWRNTCLTGCRTDFTTLVVLLGIYRQHQSLMAPLGSIFSPMW